VKVQFAKQVAFNEDNKAAKEAGYIDAMNGLQKAEPWNDESIKYMDVTKWEQILRCRKMLATCVEDVSQEMEIQLSLNKQVEVKFGGQTLSQVMDTQQDDGREHSPQPECPAPKASPAILHSLNLTQPVSQEAHAHSFDLQLGYIIRSEVLEVVSKNSKDANTYAQVYYVADLVIGFRTLSPAITWVCRKRLESLNALGYGGGGCLPITAVVPLGLAANDQQNASASGESAGFAQQPAPPRQCTGGRGKVPMAVRAEWGRCQADFDSSSS
jgi:hypothetical protein